MSLVPISISPIPKLDSPDFRVWLERALKDHDPNLTSGSDPGHVHTFGLTETLHAPEHESGGDDSVDHDALTNYVGSKHVDHSGISISSGGILSGGGILTSSQEITLANSDIDHDQTTNYDSNKHIDWTNATDDFLTTGSLGAGDITGTSLVTSEKIGIPGQTSLLLLASNSFTVNCPSILKSDLSVTGTSTLYGDIYTDRWLENATNTFVGVDVCGGDVLENSGGTEGYYNSALGYQSLYSNTKGYYNSALGYQSLFSNTTGYLNSAFGSLALYSNTTGYYNTAVGHQTLTANVGGIYNTAFGSLSLTGNTEGISNSAFGLQSLIANTTGGSNSAFGNLALFTNTTGDNNSAFGLSSLYSNNGTGNVAIGYFAGLRQTAASNLLIIDNQDRGSTANELAHALIYGVFHADGAASQTLKFNAAVTVNGALGCNDLTITAPSNIYALSHDSFADFAANEHIDWTNTDEDLLTIGTLTAASLTIAANGHVGCLGATTAIQIEADGDIVMSDDLSVTGTASAEQITSTDDITMAGLLTNTPAAADASVISIAGDTNARTFAGGAETVFDFKRTIGGADTTAPSDLKLIDNYLSMDYIYTGASTGTIKEVTCAANTFDYGGDWKITSGFLTNNPVYIKALDNALTIESTSLWQMTVAKAMTVNIYGSSNTTLLTNDFDIQAGSITANVYGGYFQARGATIDVQNGTPVINYYGGYFDGVGEGGADVTETVYGGYFSAVNGDTNYGIYVAAGLSYFADEIEGPKDKRTIIGGYAVKLTNKTGANSVAGQVVSADTANDDAVILNAIGGVNPIGVFLDSGVADAAEAWVVISGIADVALDDNVAAVHGNWMGAGVAAGYAATSASPAAAPTHFEEIGHCIESVAAGGAGTHILARCVLHFN